MNINIGKKESLTGVVFAIFIAIFINYSTIERLFDSSRSLSYNSGMPVLVSTLWFLAVSILLYFLYVYLFNIFYRRKRDLYLVLSIVVASVLISYLLIQLYPIVRYSVLEFLGVQERRQPMKFLDVKRYTNSTIFKYALISLFNTLFVYAQRLLYRNQEIERRNEQLKLESVKSQHSALIQQVNPHFFFNSLGSLRHIIIKGDNETAVEFLDNLTMIFRKTFKLGENTLHSLSEEMELTQSYIHIIKKRFEGKIFVDLEIEAEYNDYLLSPLSLLTLMENVVKHNTVSIKSPLHIKIYTTSKATIAVENVIVPKFEEVESHGIGLINLNKQYELLTGKGIDIDSTDKIFKVTLPLIQG